MSWLLSTVFRIFLVLSITFTFFLITIAFTIIVLHVLQTLDKETDNKEKDNLPK
ncbi:hypothetical protein [Anaerosporobacter sp.]|uniref:hypothetical protein n=1 Tax=Anaerosporobacter sp. TaxID=1872529 RepID=UPI00286F2E57|nr:hypothetical protein [Anaerosporobacter sp.]